MAGALENRGKNRGLALAQKKAKEKNRTGALTLRGQDRDEKNRGGLAGGIGYVAGNLGLGLANVGEGILDISMAAGDLLQGDTDMAKYRFLNNMSGNAQKRLQEDYNPNGAMKLAGDVASGIGNSATFLIPYAGPYLAALGYAGMGISNAAEQTGDVGLKELGYGVVSGGMEFLMDKFIGGAGQAAKNLGSSITRKLGREAAEAGAKATAKLAGKSFGKSVLTETLKGAAGEAIEEASQEALDPLLLRLFNIDENAKLDWKNVAYAGLVGGLSGGLMTAGPAAINYKSAASAGKSIRESGETADFLEHARLVVKGAQRKQANLTAKKDAAKADKETKTEESTDTAKAEETKGGIGTFIRGRRDAKASRRVAQLAETIQKNLTAYEGYLNKADKTAKELEISDAILGEMRGNVFLLENAALLESYEEAILELSDEDKAELVAEVNTRAKASGAKKTDYTVEDLNKDTDGILAGVAGNLLIRDNYGHYLQKNQAEKAADASVSPVEAARDAKTVTGEEVSAPKEATATEEIRAAEEVKETKDTEAEAEAEPETKAPTAEREEISAPVAEAKQETAPEAGAATETKEERPTETADRTEQKPAERTAEKTVEKPKPTFETDFVEVRLSEGKQMRDLSEEAYGAYNAAKVLGEALHAKIILHETLADVNGRKQNGYYDVKTHEIHVALDAGRGANGTALFTLAHEVTHYIEDWDYNKYLELEDFVKEQIGREKMAELMKSKKEFMRTLDAYKDMDEFTLGWYASDEVIADSMETILSDGKVLEALAKRDKTLWEKIRDWVLDAIRRIKDVYAGLKPNSRAAQVLSETMTDMEKLERLFTEAAVAAGKAAQNPETADPTFRKGVYAEGVRDAGERAAESGYDTQHGVMIDDASGTAMFSIDETTDGNDNWDRHFEIMTRLGELRRRKEAIERTDDYKSTTNSLIADVMKANGQEEMNRAFERYSEWMTNSEHGKISKEIEDLEKEAQEIYDRKMNRQAKKKEPDAYEAREKAIEHFGYTDNFGVAGYILPDGQMLNFSGDKEKGYGIRGDDHRAIGYIFENLKGNEALARFVKDGNIRIIAESPGITISNQTVPSDQQYAKIREFINAVKSRRAFYVDFMDEKGVNAGSVAYEGTVDETEIIYDIKEFFRTGEVRDRNDDIRYSIDDSADVSENAADTNVGGNEREETPFEKALRRSGLAHLIDGEAEAAEDATGAEPAKAAEATEAEVKPTVERDTEAERRERIRDHEILADAFLEAAQSEQEFVLAKRYRQKAVELADAEARIGELRRKAADVNREIEVLRAKRKSIDRGRPATEVEEAEAWMETELNEALSRKQGYLDELDRLGDMLQRETDRLLSMASAKPLRKTLREAQKKATAMERKAERVEKQAEERIEKVKKEYEFREEYKADRREMSVRERAARRVIGRLNTMFYNPTKQKHVPADLQALVEQVLKSEKLDTFKDTRKNLRQMAELEREIEKLEREPARTASEQERLDKMLYKYAAFEDEGLAAKGQAEALFTAFKTWMESKPKDQQDQALLDKLSSEIDGMQDMPLSQMSKKSLISVENFYKLIYHQVNNANQTFATERALNIDELGSQASEEVKATKALKFLSPKGKEWAAMDGIRKYFWKNMKPLTVFEAIGSKTYTDLFQRVLDAEGVWAKDIQEAREKIAEAREAHKYKEWDLEKREAVKTKSGTVELSLSERMALYAYAKRHQAVVHLETGGFVLDPRATVKEAGKVLSFAQIEKRLNDSTRYVMDETVMGDVEATLTAEQKAYVDEMQKYLTDMGQKGNQVSRKLYGIDIFNEEFYFPIKVKSEYLNAQTGKTGDPNIKNRGMTKEVVPGAENPLVLQGFDEVMVSHMNSMATYHAFVLPVEDLTRVLNYQPANYLKDADGNVILDDKGKPKADPDAAKDYSTLKAVIESKYGAEANDYVVQLVRDLNGGARRDAAAGLLDRGITAFKRASTMASLSVLIQQPTSIVRAGAYIDYKYLMGSAKMVDFKNHKELWERVKKYAPVAVIKEMGGYDTGVGLRTSDYLDAQEYEKGERIKGFLSDEAYRAEIFGKGAAYADEAAWIQLFEACTLEQADKLGKSRDSEEVLTAAGDRFEEIIRHTQVYDSTLTRSEYMRSKDTGAKMATAFMAEPTTIISMVAEAIMRGERGDVKFRRRTAGSVAAAIILNALAVSLIYAMRDDDEDKTYGEKYVSTLTMEIADGFNPAGYLPVARDIVSILQGYEVERTDMALIGNLVDQVSMITSSKRSVTDKVFGVSGAVSAFFGIPLTNVYRDAKGAINTLLGQVDTETTTGAGLSAAVKEEFSTIFKLFDDQTTNGYQLYKAFVSGDTAHYDRVAARYESEAAVEQALRKELRERDRRIGEAAEARMAGELDVYESIIEQIAGEGIFERNMIIRAINNEINALKDAAERGKLVPKDEEAAAEDEEEVLSLYSTSDLNDALERGDREDFSWIYQTLVTSKKEQGKTEAQAKASVKSSVTAYWKKQYIAAWEENNTAEIKRIQSILLSTGLYGNRNEVAKLGQGWVKAYAAGKK